MNSQGWWDNSWWSDFASEVLRRVEHRHPHLIDHSLDPDGFELLGDVQNQPDELLTETLAVLIDPPEGQGLRYSAVPRPKVHVIEPRSWKEQSTASAPHVGQL